MSWIVNDTRNPGSAGNRIDDNGFKVLTYNIQITMPEHTV